MTMRVAISILVFAALGLQGSMAFAAGYLPLIGPAPLRYQLDPEPVAVPGTNSGLTALPQNTSITSIVDAGPTNAPSTNRLNNAADGTNGNAEILIARSPDLPFADTNFWTNFALPFPPPPVANELISPQMLLQFFHQRFGETNEPATSVVAPVMFIPPQLIPKPPSKAVYDSP